MSGHMYDEMRRVESLNVVWRGIIQSNPATFDQLVYITIPDLDDSLKLGPCRWQPRDAVSLPAKGDDCLVILDNDREPWVVVWWPF
jgi:hypothetical protein